MLFAMSATEAALAGKVQSSAVVVVPATAGEPTASVAAMTADRLVALMLRGAGLNLMRCLPEHRSPAGSVLVRRSGDPCKTGGSPWPCYRPRIGGLSNLPPGDREHCPN